MIVLVQEGIEKLASRETDIKLSDVFTANVTNEAICQFPTPLKGTCMRLKVIKHPLNTESRVRWSMKKRKTEVSSKL